MRRTEQTKLSEFGESDEETTSDHTMFRKAHLGGISCSVPEPPIPKGQIWHKTLGTDEDWGVCNLDDTVLFVQLFNGRIHAYGEEAVCKWCGGILEIRDDKIFCIGACKKYQGEFSRNRNAFLWWEGVKSYTLRKIVAETEHLELEPRDREPISYVPNWSVLYEYEDESYAESDSLDNSEE